MKRPWIIIMTGVLLISSCGARVVTMTPDTNTPIVVKIEPISDTGNNYFISGSGSDTNSGSEAQPWQTIGKAMGSLVAVDTVYIRGGEYAVAHSGWSFQNSGMQAKPITVTNYPGEQVVLKITDASSGEYASFVCKSYVKDHPGWQTPKADYIHIVGSDVSPKTLSNGVQSRKGLVIQGVTHEQSNGIFVTGCDGWEVGGVDFVELSNSIFTEKSTWQLNQVVSTDHWYIHDTWTYNFYRENGMHFEGNNSRIENNEIYKGSTDLNNPYGCSLLDILGNNNTVSGNTLSRLGSKAECEGITFEWDLADANVVENN